MKNKFILSLLISVTLLTLCSCKQKTEVEMSSTGTVVYNTVEPTPEPEPEPQPEPKPQLEPVDNSDWQLILVNKEYPLTKEINMTLKTIYGNYKADSRIVEAYREMSKAAENDGIHLVVHSAYRSIEKQQSLYTRKVNQYLSRGYSNDDAAAAVLSIVAYPGQSEHHTGLCLDITSNEWLAVHGSDPLISGFADSESGKWLKENARNYGFILRYPLGKEDITGYTFEPWHFRYVGVDNANFIENNNLTLEEYKIFLGI